MSLKETLEKYSKSNIYPFHMPGHKRMLNGAYSIDMTEVEGVDDLHDPKDVIAAEQKRLAKLYKSEESFILVGGSTVGNLSAIYGCCNEGDLILIQRNSHRSVYNAAILRHLKVEYIYSSQDENGIFNAVTLDDIQKSIEYLQKAMPRAIVITSPTYEGIICNIETIADYCHKKNIILIVDSAHGAHFGFHQSFKGLVVSSADVTIMSLHKTLPCLTQTAALHISGDRVDGRRIREALDIFETSSPSYVLMSSVSDCLDYLEKAEDYFDPYVDKLIDFYKIGGQLKHLSLYESNPENRDMGKLVISTRNSDITGVELAKILREEYMLETELSSFSYVLAMTSVMDSQEGFDRLKKALLEIDSGLKSGNIHVPSFKCSSSKEISKKAMEPWEAKAKSGTLTKIEISEDEICQDSVCLYPPGSPILVPGERITKEALEMIQRAKAIGIHVTGINNGCISIVN